VSDRAQRGWHWQVDEHTHRDGRAAGTNSGQLARKRRTWPYSDRRMPCTTSALSWSQGSSSRRCPSPLR
jgi:hypothetical protein